MIDFIPPSILVQIGPFPIHFYGLAYAVGLAATYLVMSHEASRRGHNPEILSNGLIIVAIAAIIGGRLYHVIDQIAFYKDHIVQALLPVDQAGNFIGFGGLGVYGGIVTGTIAAIVYVRRRRADFWLWADIVAPGLFAMQAAARWGNFFNQELYGPPTNLPWGIAIQCSHRIAQYACPAGSDPAATLGEHFHPLFLYESLSGLFGVLALMFVARKLSRRVRTGDLLALFFIWYGITRFALEFFRADNWTFFGVPMAQIFSTISILVGLVLLVIRHRSGAPTLVAADAAAMVAAVEAREAAVEAPEVAAEAAGATATAEAEPADDGEAPGETTPPGEATPPGEDAPADPDSNPPPTPESAPPFPR